MSRVAKFPSVEFMGVRYYQKLSGYYQADPRKYKTTYLHRAVWEHHNGLIPVGHHVHHIDHNRANNAIENLELVKDKEHLSRHSKGNSVWANMTEEKRARVKEWHRSPEGRADHRRRALAAWAKEKAGPPPTHACIRCGKPYQSYRPKKGFCSMACQQASRRASGKDSETRQCVVCSAPFTVRDKYSPKRACSPKCTGVLKSKAATAQHAAHRVRQTPK